MQGCRWMPWSGSATNDSSCKVKLIIYTQNHELHWTFRSKMSLSQALDSSFPITQKKNPHFWPNKKGEDIIVAWDCRHITLHIKALKTTCRIKEQHSRRVSQPTQWSGGQTEKQPEPETQTPSDHLSNRLRRKWKYRCNCALKNQLYVLSISNIHKLHDIFSTARKHKIKATGSGCKSRKK